MMDNSSVAAIATLVALAATSTGLVLCFAEKTTTSSNEVDEQVGVAVAPEEEPPARNDEEGEEIELTQTVPENEAVVEPELAVEEKTSVDIPEQRPPTKQKKMPFRWSRVVVSKANESKAKGRKTSFMWRSKRALKSKAAIEAM